MPPAKRSSSSSPSSSKPASGSASGSRSGSGSTSASGRSAGRSTSGRSTSGRAASAKSASAKSASAPSTAGKSASPRSAAAKSGNSRSASGKSASAKSASGRSTSGRSAAGKGTSSSGRSASGSGRSASGAGRGAAAGRTRPSSGAGRGSSSTSRSAAAHASGDGILSLAEQIARGLVNPRDLVMLTRERIQETLDDAASRGRVTRKDANDLVVELMRLGRAQSDDLLAELEALVERGREGLESAAKRARGSGSVDRIVRGADRARRTAKVGPSFPILGYEQLTAPQVQRRVRELSRPELRKVLNYERKHANRKSVVSAIEKSLG